MANDAKKLRKGLANLFKTQEEMTATAKREKPNFLNRKLSTRETASSGQSKREPPIWMYQEDAQLEEQHTAKKKSKKNEVQMEQGKEPLSNKAPSKKFNGQLNEKKRDSKNLLADEEPPTKDEKNLNEVHNYKKKSESNEKIEKRRSENGSSKQAEIKKQQKPKKRCEDIAETKQEKQHIHQISKAEAKLKENVVNPSKKQSTKAKQKEKNQKKSQSPKQSSQDARCPKNSAQKRKSYVKADDGPKQKKPKQTKGNTLAKQMNIWSSYKRASDTSSEGSGSLFGSDSLLESDYDSDLDDTYESSDIDFGEEEDYYDEYSLSSSSEQYSSDCDAYDASEYDLADNCSDPDYELPKKEVEDMIVHKGLAVIYDLEDHHGVAFDETFEDSHIVELPNQIAVKTVKQYEAYTIEKLRMLELNYHEQISMAKAPVDADDCPKLVPIEGNNYESNDESFNLWTSGVTMDDDTFGDDYELVDVSDSDESSTLSYSDVNRKYLQLLDGTVSDDDESDMEEQSEENHHLKAFIIDASKDNIQQIEKRSEISNLEIAQSVSTLSEIIQKTSESLCNSNVKITKAVIRNFDEENIDEEHDESAFEIEVEKILSNYHKSKHVNSAKGVAIDENPMESSMESPIESINHTTENSMDLDALPESEGIHIENTDSLKMLYHHDDMVTDSTVNKRKPKFTSKFCNSIDSFYVLVLLKSPFYIYGTINAKLIAGSTEIYGYKLKFGEMITIHSPRGCSAVPIQPTPSSSSANLAAKQAIDQKIFAQIQALSDIAEFIDKEVKELLSNYDANTDAILLLTRNEAASKIKYILQQHINENIYPAHIPQSRPLAFSETMLDCMVNASTEYALQIPPQWLNIHLRENSKLMLVGGKSVGKSTFLRYLLNKHLADFPRILLIDLDIGQPEVFVPQTVSCTMLEKPLIGPGFFWQHQPDKAYAVGHTNLVLCAHAYMRAVLRLIAYCQTQTAYKNVPWLINTMGYNKGFACELISVICSHLQPTDIIQLQSNKPINNFDVLFHPAVLANNIQRNIYNNPEYNSSKKYLPKHQLHIMPSAVLQESRYQREWQMSAKDMRYVMLLAHLSTILPDDGEWINLSKTFGHNLQKLKIVNLIKREASERETLKSLECNLVYLCHVDKVHPKSVDNEVIAQQNDEPIECLGLGIVRGIDYFAKQVFIIPAIPLEKLPYVNCLALGEMPLPGSLLTEQNPKAKHIVPFVQVMNDEATSRAVKQFFYRT